MPGSASWSASGSSSPIRGWPASPSCGCPPCCATSGSGGWPQPVSCSVTASPSRPCATSCPPPTINKAVSRISSPVAGRAASLICTAPVGGSAATDRCREAGAPHTTQAGVAPAASAPHSAHLTLHRQARLPIVVAADPDASDHGSLWRLSADFRKRKRHSRAGQALDGVRTAVALRRARAPAPPTRPGRRGDRQHPPPAVPRPRWLQLCAVSRAPLGPGLRPSTRRQAAGLAESPGSTALRRRVPRSGTITRQISLFCTAQLALVEELVSMHIGGYARMTRVHADDLA